MNAIEQVYDRLNAERAKGPRADAKKIEALDKELHEAIDKAEEFVEQNEYDRIVESNGGVGMNALMGFLTDNCCGGNVAACFPAGQRKGARR